MQEAPLRVGGHPAVLPFMLDLDVLETWLLDFEVLDSGGRGTVATVRREFYFFLLHSLLRLL